MNTLSLNALNSTENSWNYISVASTSHGAGEEWPTIDAPHAAWHIKRWIESAKKAEIRPIALAKSNTGNWLNFVNSRTWASASNRIWPALGIWESDTSIHKTPSHDPVLQRRFLIRNLCNTESLYHTSLDDFPDFLSKTNNNDKWLDILSTIDSWSKLDNDWFDDESISPNYQTISNAREFISKIFVQLGKEPTPYIAPDGEIGFRWQSIREFASVSFLDDGEFVGVIRSNESGQKYIIDCPFVFWNEYISFVEALNAHLF